MRKVVSLNLIQSRENEDLQLKTSISNLELSTKTIGLRKMGMLEKALCFLGLHKKVFIGQQEVGFDPKRLIAVLGLSANKDLLDIAIQNNKFEDFVIKHSMLQEGTFHERQGKIFDLELKYQSACTQLDKTIKEYNLKRGNQPEIDEKTVENIKKVILSGYKALLNTKPPTEEVHTFLPINNDIRLAAVSTPTGLKITGLFGKVIGAGTFGTAYQTVDLLKGKWSKDDFAVAKVINKPKKLAVVDLEDEKKLLEEIKKEELKLPQGIEILGKIEDDISNTKKKKEVLEELLKSSLSEELKQKIKDLRNMKKYSLDLANEVAILNKIHKGENAKGIQKSLRLLKDFSIGKPPVYVHFGMQYSDNLSRVKKLSSIEKRQVSKDLILGLCNMHQAKVTNGDLKPQNIFCFKKEEEWHPHLADFGGAVDHDKDPPDLLRVFSPAYSVCANRERIKKVHAEKNYDEYFNIAKSLDVYAICMSIAKVGGYKFPKVPKPKPKDSQELETLLRANIDQAEEIIKSMGFPSEVESLLIKGLDTDYTKRPTAEEIYQAMERS